MRPQADYVKSAHALCYALSLSKSTTRTGSPPGNLGKPAHEPDTSISYNCDQGTFTVTYSNDRKTAYLQMGAQTIVLDKTPSLEPAVYSAHGLSFWPEGSNNIFVKRDMSALYQNCTSVR